LVGFIPGAYVVGKLTENARNPRLPRVLTALFLGQAAIYLIGIPYLYFNLTFIIHKPVSLSTVIKAGLLAFIPGDILKTIIAATVVTPMRRRLSSFIQ
jgi:biotin transport system substrate-specific component